MSCPVCFTYDCNQVEDTDLYSLESDLFPWVLDCPPGYDCQLATQFNIVCCGQLLSTAIPVAADLETRLSLIRDVLKQCYVRDLYCSANPPPNQPPILPPNPPAGRLYFNEPQAYTVYCPDGSPFTFTVPAGWFVAATRFAANQAAFNFAKAQAKRRRMCLPDINSSACLNEAYSATFDVQGGLSPFSFSITSGVLPTGLLLTPTSDTSAVIAGTPTVEGNFTFVVRVDDNYGGYMEKTYSICVILVGPATLPDATVGTAYSASLTVTSCANPNQSWQVVAGALPGGLTIDEQTGIISGTPTGPTGTVNFTIRFQDNAT